MAPFRDRSDAGRRLAPRVAALGLASPVVLGLPRGGIPVAAEVAAAVVAPLEVFVARKIGMPGHEELGIGAVAEGLDEPVVADTAAELGVSGPALRILAERARSRIEHQVFLYRGDRPLPPLGGRDVVLVDDGLATGVTAEAALRALRARQPGRLVLAVPAGARQTVARLAHLADQIMCAQMPARFLAVGQWYEDFSQTTDAEVLDLLARGRTEAAERP